MVINGATRCAGRSSSISATELGLHLAVRVFLFFHQGLCRDVHLCLSQVTGYASIMIFMSAYQQSVTYEQLRIDPQHWTGLKDGWLFGRSRDDSDIQWREFRNSLPALSAALAGFVCVSRAVRMGPSYEALHFTADWDR